MEVMFYNWDVPFEQLKEFVKPHLMIPSYDIRDKDLPKNEQRIDMWHIDSRFGLLTIHTNTYIIKTSDDIFIMSKESYDELCLDEIENI